MGPLVTAPRNPRQGTQAKVAYDEGTNLLAAAKLAAASDVAIVFASQWTCEGSDVPDLSLPDDQDELICQVAAANAHTIVVLETGGAVLMPWIDKTSAVLESWYPGQRGGEAIANLLFGEAKPSGKLPITFPRSEMDLPQPLLLAALTAKQEAAKATPNVNYNEGLRVGYKWYDAEKREPLFPFGFGLSYTTFSYSQLRVTRDKQMRVTFNVHRIPFARRCGDRPGLPWLAGQRGRAAQAAGRLGEGAVGSRSNAGRSMSRWTPR